MESVQHGTAPLAPLAGDITMVQDLQPTLELDQLLRGQGIDPQRAPRHIKALTEGLLDEVRSLVTPAALYTIRPLVELDHERVVLGDGAGFSGSLVTRALAGATHVALAVCTIGPALDGAVEGAFSAGEALRALALDGAGNAAVGEVARIVGTRLCDEASDRGLRVGMRASPGQEGWPIVQQRVLFGLVPAGQIGVQLTSSCMMVPRKSVSFVVGLGPEMRADAVPCDFCSKRDTCRWRKPGQVAGGDAQ